MLLYCWPVHPYNIFLNILLAFWYFFLLYRPSEAILTPLTTQLGTYISLQIEEMPDSNPGLQLDSEVRYH